MKSFNAVINLGKVDGYGNGRRTCPVVLKIEYTAQNERDSLGNAPAGAGGKISISAGVYNHIKTDIIQGGQCVDAIERHYKYSQSIARICALWRRWHLNDMRAGCVHVMDDLRAREKSGGTFKTEDGQDVRHTYYKGAHAAGEKWSAPEDERDGGLLCKPCPVCGAKYGANWYHEPLPAEVLAEVVALIEKIGTLRGKGSKIEYK